MLSWIWVWGLGVHHPPHSETLLWTKSLCCRAGGHSLTLSDICHMCWNLLSSVHRAGWQSCQSWCSLVNVSGAPSPLSVCSQHLLIHPFIRCSFPPVVRHLQQQVSQWHICKRPCHCWNPRLVHSYEFQVKSRTFSISRQLKQVSKYLLSPFSHIVSEPTAARRDHKPMWTAEDVKLNAEHTDGVINTLAWLA